ncbi:MAG TPA: HAD family hydrolase [Polyangiaceae bacterium]|nr:HAD family hydrolase [Polyangiaceae bacterium]
MRAVSFDFGQTLAELDHDFLALRVRSFGAQFDPNAARAANHAAWEAYGAAKSLGHARAWQNMMLEFLRAGGLRPATGPGDPDYAEKIVLRLWNAQPTHNLWRKPVAGMFELVHECVSRQIPVAIISNSEGRLAELLEELGEAASFRVIVDSGRLGIDKPDARIFQHAANALGVSLDEIVHVGDAWEADVIGARSAGTEAIWFAPSDARALPPGVVACRDALELRSALHKNFGLALS